MNNQLINLLSVGFIFVLVVLGCSRPAESNKTSDNSTTKISNTISVNSTPNSSEKTVKVSAKELTKTYAENELAADSKYKGNLVEVNGKISNIAETLGNITVSLEGHNGFITVMCGFNASEKDSLLKLKKGQQITLIGRGDGMTGGLYAGLTDCKIQ